MGKRSAKRSRLDFEDEGNEANEETNNGVGETLKWLEKNGEELSSGVWTTVGKNGKRQKTEGPLKTYLDSPKPEKKAKNDNSKPALKFAQTHKLNRALKISDLQSLVLYCLADGPSPQFVAVSHHGQVKKAVVLMVPGMEIAMFEGNIKLPDSETPCNDVKAAYIDDIKMSENTKSCDGVDTHVKTSQTPDDFLPTPLVTSRLPPALVPLASHFDRLWPVKAPGDDKYAKLHSPLHAMLTTPITKSEDGKRANKDGRRAKPAQQNRGWVDERTPITAYIASKEALQENDYVLHSVLLDDAEEKHAQMERRELANQTWKDGWKDTLVNKVEEGVPADESVQKGSITAGRTLLAIDCEMCLVEGNEYALTRISIVGWDGQVVLDEYVKPEKPIIDYLTPYSGITPQILSPVTTTLIDIQKRLLVIFHPQTILIGHSLDSDLRAMKMIHPFIVDTSILYPHPRGPPLKSSLKWLSQKYLSREIQKGHGTSGHNSIEDARATLDLVKQKCEKGPKWGSSEANQESIFKRLSRAYKTGVRGTAVGDVDKRTTAIVDHGNPERSFGTMASHCIGCKSDAEVVAGVERALTGDADGAEIPGGGVDFIWARLRELEALRGWWNDNRSQNGSAAEKVGEPAPAVLAAAVSETVKHITNIRESLPPCTLLIVYTGSGDPREMARLQEMQRTFKKEYRVKKWDQLSVRWTDTEEQALKAAVKVARNGIGLICVS